MSGRMLTNIPPFIRERFGDADASYRNYRHWVVKDAQFIYKITPKGSEGQRNLRLEGEILSRLNHPNFPSVSFVDDAEWEIIKIKLIDGNPLGKIREKLSTAQKTKLLTDIEESISHLNAQGFLHTDIGPDNVIWDGNRAYLIDLEEARAIVPPLEKEDSPDFVGGPPCCWGDGGYGYNTYQCFRALSSWLLNRECSDLYKVIRQAGIWNPKSFGNKCDAWTTLDDDSIYQTVRLGNDVLKGQRDPNLRFRYLLTSKVLSFHQRTILDIGCNLGRLGAFLEDFGTAQYVGVDLSPEYIEIAASLAKLEQRKRSMFLAGDICSDKTLGDLKQIMPQGYDVIVCQSVYHHIPDKRKFWRHVGNLGCKYFIFEGPTEGTGYILSGSWAEEIAYIQSQGYETVFESDHNDFRGRLLTVFRKTDVVITEVPT